MREIEVRGGYKAMVDDEDYDRLARHKWYVRSGPKTVYAIRYDPSRTTIAMHRHILNTPKGIMVDHVDGNGLNNQKKNLREATQSENQCNRGRNKNNTTGYKGVYKAKNKWQARIILNRKAHHLGTFVTKELAHLAYAKAAKKLHGEFANHN